jgi:hypothetical protein
MMNLPQVLWDNLFARSGYVTAYTGTETAGFERQNAWDWFDWSSFRPSLGTSSLEVTLPAGATVDAAVLFSGGIAGLATSVSVEYETAPAVWASLGTFGAPAAGMVWLDIGSTAIGVGRKVRFLFTGVTGTIDVRQVTVGARLSFPTGQWSGMAPPTLTSGVVTETVISIAGSMLGRNVRRMEKTAEIALDYLEQSWVRATWEPFAQHATRFSFWYRWNPTEYPAEIALAGAMEIKAPTNGKQPFMSLSMPLKVITD